MTNGSSVVAAPVAVPQNGEVEIPAALNFTRDQIRWGPVIAGLVTALTTMLLLNLLGVALGLTSANFAAAARQNNVPANAGQYAAIWAAVSAAIAFFIGGCVAGKTAAVFSRGAGALNGAMVFLLAVPVTLWLASLGLGALMGTLGSFAGGLNVEPGQIQNTLQDAAQQARQAVGGEVGGSEAAQAANAARTAAWGALLGMLIGLGAAALGGMTGTRREIDVDATTSHLS
ncbi:MAG: hypothetical protein KY445_15590 [Armatimonadetes bacterium]|nr:hypothetical protein [Armatimonadota bacterium]